MKAALFDAGARRARHGATKAVVHVPLSTCPTCGGDLDYEQIEEDALFRHGGHGATRCSRRAHCRCGWTLLVESSEIRPPRGAA